MDNNNCTVDIAKNGVLTNGNKTNEIRLTLNHNESETSIGQDLDSFYEITHNHIEQTKRETEKRYMLMIDCELHLKILLIVD